MKPTIKKLLWSGSLGVVALILLPVVAAYEAHVINVTAEITNALEADVYSIDFGTVFPQEKFEKPFSIGLSQSFIDSAIYDDVEYVLRQKPKCVRDPQADQALPPFGQTKEDESGNFVCKDEVNYNLMPFLCPYLSKVEQTTDGTAPNGENDMTDPDPLPGHTGPLASFHGPILLAPEPGGWNMNTTLQYQLLGRMAKSEQDLSDTWNIDLKVPCFGNHCAQDWADFVAANDGNNNAVAADYIQPLANEHQIFGCDLWVEVRDLSLNSTKGVLTVVKHTISDNGGQLNSPDFQINITGVNPNPASFPGDEAGTVVTLDPGPYSVAEDGTHAPSYDSSLSADCVGAIAAGEQKTCTITNDDKPGTLIVKKTLINDDGGTLLDKSNFSFQVGVGPVTPFESDGQNDLTVDAGTYTVTEPAVAGYTTTYNNCTDLVIPNGGTATCTVTNDDNEQILACNAKLDLMLVLDRSGSIDAAELLTLKNASHSFVDVLGPTTAGAHVGQSSFSTTASLDQILTGEEADIHLAINAVNTGGTTDLEAGISIATNQLGGLNDRTPDTDPDYPDVIVIVTDGNPNVPNVIAGRTDAATAADAARLAGIEVFVIGVGADVDATFLTNDIADDAAHYFAAANFSDLEAKLQQIVACTSTLKRYTFAGVTRANDGIGGNPLALEHDSDLFPWTGAGDQNSANDPSNAQYVNIRTDNNTRWNSANPGGGDFMVKRFRFFLTEALADIDDIKFTWKGQPDTTANTSVWVLKTGLSEFTAGNWVQLGSGLSIPSDTDRYLIRHIAAVDVATYVAGAGGQIDVIVAIDNDNEVLRTDYIQLLVTSSP